MTSPWLLLAATGVTAGAIGGFRLLAIVTAATVAGHVLARREWWAVALVTLIGGTIGIARVETSSIAPVDDLVPRSDAAEVRVASFPQSGPSGPRAIVEVERVGIDGAWSDASGRVLLFFGSTVDGAIGQGDRLRVVWKVTALEAQEPGFGAFVRSNGAAANAWAFHTSVLERASRPTNAVLRLRETFTDRLQAGVGGDAGALLAGFVTGDDSGLSAATRAAFDRTNTSHITAVSGSNVAVLVTLWLLVVGRPRWQRAIWAQLAIVTTIWLYVAMVGFNPGAVRAGLFASVLLPAARLGRRADPLTALMLASAAMLLVRPGYADSVGFWLSLAASAAMVAAVGQRRDAPVWVLGLLALLAAQVATLPITFVTFGGWSPGSLVANLLIGPLVSVLFPIAFVLAVPLLVAPWFADVVGWAPKLGADAVIAMVESLASEFPLLRPGPVTPATFGLIAGISAVIIGVLSADVIRWLRRVAQVRAWTPARVGVAMLGVGAGVWVALAATLLVG